MITVYVSIGNSDDKLAQAEWSNFATGVAYAISSAAATVHGEWFSSPVAPWQNACWCFEIGDVGAALLKEDLRAFAAQYGQDSIAWAVAETEFVGAAESEGE